MHQVLVNNGTILDTFYGTTFGNSIVVKVFYTFTTPVQIGLIANAGRFANLSNGKKVYVKEENELKINTLKNSTAYYQGKPVKECNIMQGQPYDVDADETPQDIVNKDDSDSDSDVDGDDNLTVDDNNDE